MKGSVKKMELILDASKNKDYLRETESFSEKPPADLDELEASRPRERKLREVYIPEEELEKLRGMYSKVVVQDFDDEYHMSTHDREILRNRYSKLFTLRQNYTKKIRKISKFIEACRLALQIVDETAENQKAMPPDEFRYMVLNGDITINGLRIPKFVGKGKKTLNWKYVMKYILDPSLDTSIFTRDTLANTEDDITGVSISEEEMNKIMDIAINYDPEKVRDPELFVEMNDTDFATVVNKKDQRSITSVCPSYNKVLKTINRRASKENQNAMIWQLTDDDIKWIEEYDKKNNSISNDIPKFKGNINNPEDVSAYLYNLEEIERDTTYVEYRGSYITQSDLDEIKFKEILERNNYNLRNLYGNKEREKKRKEEAKQNKAKIKELKKMLMQMENKQTGGGLTGDIILHSKEELESKGKINKKKKKDSKKAKKNGKVVDEAVMDIYSPGTSMKEYSKKMSSMSLLK